MFFIFVMVVSLNIISAGCCQELKDGTWCQNVEEDRCKEDSKFAPTVCSSTSYCTTGTCVNSDTGKCMINVPQSKCIEDGGVWKEESPQEIPACQNGCCLYGDKAAYVNHVECKQIASDYGVSVNFREDIGSQTTCFALANRQEEGACVIENEYQTTCLRTTKKECLNKKDKKGSSSILSLFEVSSGGSNVKVDFYPGYLCTAEELGTDCAPTENTRCSNDKAYFVDSCGNLANIYDETMFPLESEQARDYWTEIQEPECTIEGTTSSTCGDCDYQTGTLCATYDRNDEGMPDEAPEYGNKVCRDLACYYDTNGNGNIEEDERYEHGESWCAETPGTYHHLPLGFDREGNIWNRLTSKQGVTEEYNVPGSRYVKLECRNGQVLEQPCKDYRNEICAEQSLAEVPRGDGEYTRASCISNAWRNCFGIGNRTSCENAEVNNIPQCKWIEGYRFDFENMKKNSDPMNMSKQGSCVPLFSPGFDFWNSSGTSKQGAIKEKIMYEVGIIGGGEREELSKDAQTAAERCFSQNCYAIPGYGSDISDEEWEEIWDGDKGQVDIIGSNDISEYTSERKGHYCPGKTGTFIGQQPDCTKASGKNDKIANPPIFKTHTQWINSIMMRARSLGDVGYKKGIGDYWGQKNSEEVISIVQKLNQDMKTKSNMTEEFVMYRGGEYTQSNQRMTSWIGKVFDELFNEEVNQRKESGF